MCFLLRAMLKNMAERWRVVLFTLRSLTFNSATSRVVVLDTIFQPVFWVVDNFVGVLGPAFVLLVIGLTTSVVVIYYTVLLPVIMEYSVSWIAFHLVTSHWLLLNIAFHYFKAVFTSPGSTPQQKGLDDFGSGKYSICKKCIQPKFPRTHHCSICKRCILKMDHHCPWINNCVGHFNHRYFISFCIFMCIGTFYVAVSSKDLFTKHFYHNNWISTESSPPLLTDGRNSTSVHLRNETQFNRQPNEDSAMDYEHKCVIYLFMLCSAVTVALGVLTGWHCRLIGRGETSIEVHINSEDRKRLRKQGLVFRNPYNFGVWNNWRMLLGLVNGRSWLDVLLPSSHLPFGDGLSWPPPPPDVKKDGKIHVV